MATAASGLPFAVAQPPIPTPQQLGMFVYPAKGQSAAKQESEQYECYAWAQGQTGIDPTAPPPQAPEPEKGFQADGSGVKGAAGGALVGTAVGAIAGGTGEGAAIGAIAGTLRGRRKSKEKRKEQQTGGRAAGPGAGAADAGDLQQGLRRLPRRQGVHRQMTSALAVRLAAFVLLLSPAAPSAQAAPPAKADAAPSAIDTAPPNG